MHNDAAPLLIWVAVMALGSFGYLANFYKLIHMGLREEPVSGKLLIRIFGVMFFPVGIAAGFLA